MIVEISEWLTLLFPAIGVVQGKKVVPKANHHLLRFSDRPSMNTNTVTAP
jgi:hypothetical protein